MQNSLVVCAEFRDHQALTLDNGNGEANEAEANGEATN